MEIMESVIAHSFVSEVLRGRNTVRVVDVCSGIGIAGYALSKILVEKGYGVELALIDVRRDALLRAREWIKSELGIEPEIYVIDARSAHSLGKEYDIALMWGSSSVHFDPWNMNRLLASLTHVLSNNGLLVMQEADRFYSIIMRGYKEVIYNEDEHEGKAVLDVFVGYDPLKGTCRRRVIDLRDTNRRVSIDLYYWSIASLAALLWIFFEDIDVIEILQRGLRDKYVILAYRPRKVLSPTQFEREPYLFKVRKSKNTE